MHSWGPIRLYEGENQRTGGPGHTLSWENIALLTPEALAERIENIRRTVARYHEIGIREITPYICYFTLAGDHEKREGFWKFYDNWDRYAKWAGPRPPHDPADWLRRDVHGQLMLHVRRGYPYTPDYFAPLHRYGVCTNHPDWIEWHRRLIRMVAEVGYDGCFVDNTRPDFCCCYCRYCKAAFGKFLEENRDIYWVRRLTEGLDIDKLKLDSPDVPAELDRRFRLLRTSDHMGMLRRVGRQVKPGFTIFPNGNSIRQCLTTGGQCDRLMFEGTFSPGILTADKPPETGEMDEITIRVSDDAVKSKRYTYRYELNDHWMELEADISMPTGIRVGQPVDLQVKLVGVGGGGRDNDFAEDFHLLLEDPDSGERVRLALEPRGVFGAAGPLGKGKRPPAVLKATWTPKRTGRYAVCLGFTYTDAGHIRSHPHLARLLGTQLCRTHVAELLFTQHMNARCIYLGYETGRSGWENVQELSLAELAAFSGGGGFSGHGAPQATYRTFFQKHPELFDGWQPTAPVAVLYAYWGPNPLNAHRPVGRVTVHHYLAGTHRLFVALVAARLPEQSDALAGFRAIYLQSPGYEMSPVQLRGLCEYVKRGGRVVLADEKITINGRPAAELLGRDKIALWDWSKPTTPTKPVAVSDGLRRNVRFALYRRGDRLALHVVNYNVCLLDKAKKVLEVEPTPLAVPLPGGWKAVKATCFDPDGEPQPLKCTVADATAKLTLPKLHIYKIVLLEKAS